MTKKEKVIEQIKFMCKLFDIQYEDDFIEFVYNKRLKFFSGENLKQLKEEYLKQGE